MEFVTFTVAVLALVLGGVAFIRTGGIEELRHHSASLRQVREKTADALHRLEQFIRGQANLGPGPESGTGNTHAHQ